MATATEGRTMAVRSPNHAARRSPNSSPGRDHLTPTPVTPGRSLPLDVAVAAFVADGQARGLSPRTLETYLEGIDTVRRSLPGPRLEQAVDDVAIEPARAWAAGLGIGRRPATVVSRVRSLKVFTRWCAREGYRRTDPLERLRVPAPKRTVIEAFGDDDVRLLLAAARPDLRIVLQVMLDTGVRISEAVDIRIGDVRPGGTIRIRGKGGDERLVPIGHALDLALRKYVVTHRPQVDAASTGHLVLSPRGLPLTARAVYQAMRRVGARLGLGHVRVSPHTCRHTFARAFLRNGGNLLALQQILGHRDLGMVRRYAEFAEVDLVAAQASASPLDRWARPSGRGR
ncbi:MAG: tyrosine-type recombinase/integrase [Chloroflexota bacterium]